MQKYKCYYTDHSTLCLFQCTSLSYPHYTFDFEISHMIYSQVICSSFTLFRSCFLLFASFKVFFLASFFMFSLASTIYFLSRQITSVVQILFQHFKNVFTGLILLLLIYITKFRFQENSSYFYWNGKIIFTCHFYISIASSVFQLQPSSLLFNFFSLSNIDYHTRQLYLKAIHLYIYVCY